ncbi:Ribonucleases P/MRP protein subunit pop1 [Elasticomyces elasticus]|nr:Ribonucleases P/MRP protein subunit pop1 [Elasticomyces elasticus]KAK3660189.1 Ribonucleases P/MRP protein subunit pop1 [Elasticomyces elasticus]KAK4923495.1 Ribonucleases P/MRP protein subunit pop1 [Elasticomyces elasticus]KAK5752453.1 Ribonucleases P/MRP protein subunit pop1 [Elasticomyces elasticus]
MAPGRPAQSPHDGGGGNTNRKRKDAPTNPQHNGPNKRPRQHIDQRQKMRIARTLSTQTTSTAFQNGALDVSSFVKSRAYEIQALENGLQRSKKALNERAFQQVPKELRRRTASHNVKRVPKRLRVRAGREMAVDNTPTVTARRRKPSGHMRLRLETVKKLRALGAKRKAEKDKPKDATTTELLPKDVQPGTVTTAIRTRIPKVKKSLLATPPVPKAKFRKRQIHKSWLPTHLYHAKRARMTAPSAPIWRYAVPLTPTAKSYRPTHRASHDRGAVAWDMSYMSTIQLEGRESSVLGMLKAIGVAEEDLSGRKSNKWRAGVRVLDAFLYERESPHELIAPVTMVWCVYDGTATVMEKRKRKMFLRVHPSAFYQLWEEMLRLAKVAKPAVSVEDLRFEIGSIEITGPGATEALLGALWPSSMASTSNDASDAAITGMDVDATSDHPRSESVGETWQKLAGLTNPALLPQNALLGFNVQDPRLHHPPRTIALLKSDAEQHKLLEISASWPVDAAQKACDIFDRKARHSASTSLPSQKAVNRRKGLAAPGEYPQALPKDPRVPVLLYSSSNATPTNSSKSRQSTAHNGSWTLLAPWKCLQPIWYSLMYYPLSTGQQPRFGGLDQKRQLAFEAGKPWFPGDFPGTKAGWNWECEDRRRRESEWRKRPRGKRVSYEKVELGGGKKGEVGVGWACDWERLLNVPPVIEEAALAGIEDIMDVDGPAEKAGDGTTPAEKAVEDNTKPAEQEKAKENILPLQATPKPPQLSQLSARQALALLASPEAKLPPHINLTSALVTVRLTLLTRGVPHPCARIYRLPTNDPDLRRQWLALLPSNLPHKKQKGSKHALPRLPKDASAHVVQQRLAQSLLEPPRAGEDKYPACPAEEDLVGFITTGNYDLGEGQGTGIGSLLVDRVRDGGAESNVYIVRNAGTGLGRLARWEVA